MPSNRYEPEREHQIIHAGRRVGWAEWGTPTGTPVLVCTGAGMSSSLGLDRTLLAELDVRLICVDRAGLGRSGPDVDKSLASYADDVAAVLRAQSIERPAVLGFSQGAPFSLALAGADLVSALALIAGQDELAHPRVRAMLHPEVAAMVEDIAADPAGFEAAFAEQVDAEGLWRLVLGMSAAIDRSFYEQPEFAAAYRRSLDEGFSQGPQGYVRDVSLAMSRWSTQPEHVNVPVRLWYGALDSSPVHSPDSGEFLSSRFASAIRRVLPDEGGSLLWTRSRAILNDLL